MVIDRREYTVLSIEINETTSVEQLLNAERRYADFDFALLILKCTTRSFLEILYLVISLSRKIKVMILAEKSIEPFIFLFKKNGLYGVLVNQPAQNTFSIFNKFSAVNKNTNYSTVLGSLQELSAVEMEVLFYLSAGHSNASISEILCRSYHTIKNHKMNIARKMGLEGCAQLHTFACKLRDIVGYRLLIEN